MNVKAAANGHHTTGSRLISLRAKLIMPPKLFIDGSTPTPTYDSTASYRISAENSSTVTISIRWATFGNTWRRMMRPWPTPKACAACTYSSSRSFSVSARSSRHSPAQPVSPSTAQSRNSFRSARSSPVSNSSGCLSRNTCTISTQAAISRMLGTDDSTV